MSNSENIYHDRASVPPHMRELLDEHLHEGEQLLLGLQSDLNMSGRFINPNALIATDQRLLRLDIEGVAAEVPLAQVAIVHAKHFLGNGMLVLTTWDDNVRMLRFSASRFEEVDEFVEALEQVLSEQVGWEKPQDEEQRPDHADEDDTLGEISEQAPRCPECGNLLPPGQDICNACLSKHTVLLRMLSYLKPHKGMAAIAILLSLVMAGMGAAIPRLGRTFIDDAVAEKDEELLTTLIVIMGALFLGRAVIAGVRRLLMMRLAQTVMHELRQQVYAHLQRLSMSYHDKKSTGRLISRVIADTSRLQRFLVMQVQQLLVDVLTLVVILVWMLRFSVKLTMLLWLPLPLFYFLIRWYRDHVHDVLRKAFRERAAMSGHLSDTIPGVSMVKAFSQEERVIDQFENYSEDFKDERIRATGFSSFFAAAFLLLTQIGILLVYWFGGYAAIRGDAFTIGSLLMFLGWTRMMYQPVRRFARLTEQFENATASAERVFD